MFIFQKQDKNESEDRF